MFFRALLAITLAVCLDMRAYAHGESGADLPADAPAVTKEGEKAKAELARLTTAEGPKELLADPLKKGRAAIARAHGASLAGDDLGAKLLSRVALAWSQAAAATLRAFDSERGADSAESKATAQKDQIQRKKALLIEMEARKMSLAKEVAAAESEAAPGAKAAEPPKSTQPSKKKTGDKADAKGPATQPSGKKQAPASEKPKK